MTITIEMTKKRLHQLIENDLFSEDFLNDSQRVAILESQTYDDDDLRHLLHLAQGDNIAVKCCLATHATMPEEILEVLSFDDEEAVKHALILNKNLSDDLLEDLADDELEQIAQLAQERLDANEV